MQLVKYLILSSLSCLLNSSELWAECLGNIEGLLEIKVKSCESVKPLEYFKKPNSVPHGFYNHYDHETIAKTLASHAGSLVTGIVIGSKAVDTSLDDKAALLGQEVQVFVEKERGQCGTDIVVKKDLLGSIRSSCCDGVIAPPCLLPTNYLLTPIKLEDINKVKSKARNMPTSTIDSDVIKARESFEGKEFKNSINAYLSAIKRNIYLEPTDSYLLGLSYFMVGQQCTQAIPHLEKVRARASQLSGELILPYMKRGMLLLARCYAIERDSDRSVLILEEMLVDAKNFSKEIGIAMYHADFGWIKTTLEFRSFLEKAREHTKVPVPQAIE